MIPIWVRRLIEKYSFIEKTDYNDGYFYMFYKNGEKLIYKRISGRANRKQLESAIEKIKKEINYAEKKKDLDKRVIQSMSKKVPIINIGG